MEEWKQRARQLKADTYALYLAYRDPRVPWYARLVAAGVLAYALSPIDLIPDFVPVLGQLDDALLVAAALAYVLRRAGRDVVEELWRGSPAGLASILRLV